jgi:hypothetical protein
MSILDNAKRHIESLVTELEGDDDFMPFLITRRDDKEFYVGLAAMTDETKDDMADVMFAAVAVTRAEEAVFASVSWVVRQASDEEDLTDIRPSQHPQRQEAVFITQVTRDGDAIWLADLVRQDGRAVLKDWDQAQIQGGRFARALSAGMRLGAQMPEEFQEWCQAAIDSGHIEDVLRPAMSAFRKIRTGQVDQ